MPGYLGSERQFSVRYSRPILQSRDARSSSKEQEAGDKELLLADIPKLFCIYCYRLNRTLLFQTKLRGFVLGALAVESLHKQVLPFLLRRLKSDVLQDLPPKIIQDYYCELSPLQVSAIYKCILCFDL